MSEFWQKGSFGNRTVFQGFMKSMSLRFVALVFLGIMLVGVGFGSLGAAYLMNKPTGIKKRDVTIRKGMTVAEISNLLYREGVVRSPRLIRLFSILNGTDHRLTAGIHTFHGGMTGWQVLQELEVPRDVTRDVTLPEGLRMGQVARILAQSLGLEEVRLLEITSDPTFCRSLGVDAENLEGYLFPETYKVSLYIDEEQIVRLLVKQFFDNFDKKMVLKARDLGMSVQEVVTLASIIEGEAQLDVERPIVSAVYHNRLKRKMRLQADPTVQYALSDGPRRLFYKDYRIDSPYNTYRYSGLPPGPIMNPGAASLRAALYPADVDYLFFVAKGDGSHVFSRTSEEHEVAKQKTRQARRKTWQRPPNSE